MKGHKKFREKNTNNNGDKFKFQSNLMLKYWFQHLLSSLFCIHLIRGDYLLVHFRNISNIRRPAHRNSNEFQRTEPSLVALQQRPLPLQANKMNGLAPWPRQWDVARCIHIGTMFWACYICVCNIRDIFEFHRFPRWHFWVEMQPFRFVRVCL